MKDPYLNKGGRVEEDHLLPREWVLEALALPEPDRAPWMVNGQDNPNIVSAQ